MYKTPYINYKVHEFAILFAGKDTIDSQNINNKFSVKYYLNLFLVDKEDRCYIKQQEMTARNDVVQAQG